MNHRMGENEAGAPVDDWSMLTDSLVLLETLILSGVAGSLCLVVWLVRNLC